MVLSGSVIPQCLVLLVAVSQASSSSFLARDDEPDTATIRLVREEVHSDDASGRLEVLFDGEWGTVCDDYFGDGEASVVCRSLGLSSGVARAGIYFGRGSGQIWLDDGNCDAEATSLMECSHREWGDHNCDHSEDVGVECLNATDHVLELPMRLAGGPEASNSSGRLEVFVAGRWGTVCDDEFGDTSATVVCNALGFTYGIERPQAYYGRGSGTIWLDQVICEGDEASLLECRHNMLGSHDCVHSEDVGVECYTSTDVSEDGALRLVDGPSEQSGRLEVFHAYGWGTICSDAFGDVNAFVACRSLGYSYGVVQDNNYGTADDNLRIFLDDVRCDGNESQLADCHHIGWGNHNCRHFEDVSVDCYQVGGEDGDEWDLRLVDGPNNSSGRLEVFHLNHWGTVCASTFNENAVAVVCRSLGHQSGVVGSFSNADEGVPTWLPGAYCDGGESRLADCDCGYWGPAYCGYDHVGVTCMDGGESLTSG